ncbi:hypothetical protein [Vibrio sp. 1CM23M]|uniref:hypothetical protein n=1 Tax=Vibrio sp. 1CM23M TaxID=2929164 RepID=UPI0020BFA1D1|nr:hypothetical protein [Vibrio sp. 1CM23M]MCK8073699.1 hypothetical protein [Vibrio sp. 1CM23M]
MQKTHQRLQEFCRARNYNWEHQWQFNGQPSLSLRELHQASEEYLPSNETAILTHSDLCFSNILYDFCKDRINVIDPRGVTASDTKSIYGHIEYDLTKICHSAMGLYDWVIAGYYQVSIDDYQVQFSLADATHSVSAQQVFTDALTEQYSLSRASLYAMQIQLLLSMLPLHSDDPLGQDALMANAFRLYYLML